MLGVLLGAGTCPLVVHVLDMLGVLLGAGTCPLVVHVLDMLGVLLGPGTSTHDFSNLVPVRGLFTLGASAGMHAGLRPGSFHTFRVKVIGSL